MNEIQNLVNEKGMIMTKDITRNNKSKVEYYNYLKNNNFDKISRGIYASKNAWIDQLLIAHIRCPKAVLSHEVALYYHGLIDREPISPTLTIYSGYNTSKLSKSGYKTFFIKREYLELGKMEVIDYDGNVVPMYDLERTMCDLVRNRNSFEIQDFSSALKAYARKREKNIAKLFEYAKVLRVEKIIRSYMEILL